jgi:hypothetical protein
MDQPSQPDPGAEDQDAGPPTPPQQFEQAPNKTEDPEDDNPQKDPADDLFADPVKSPLPPTRQDGGGGAGPAALPSAAASEGSPGGLGGSAGGSSASPVEPAALATNAAQQEQTRQAAMTQAVATTASAANPAPAVSPAELSSVPPSAVSASPAVSPAGGGLIGIDPAISAVEGALFIGTVAEFQDPDGNTDPSVYSVSVSWGDGSAATPGSVSYSGGVFNVFDVFSGHTYAEEGTYTVSTTVTDNADHDVTTLQNTATVRDASLSVNGTRPPLQLSAGVAFSGGLASFLDADPQGVPADYTSSISWGDGTTPTSGSNTGSGNSPTISGSHTYCATDGNACHFGGGNR